LFFLNNISDYRLVDAVVVVVVVIEKKRTYLYRTCLISVKSRKGKQHPTNALSQRCFT